MRTTEPGGSHSRAANAPRLSIFDLAAGTGCFWCGDDRTPRMHPTCRAEMLSSATYRDALERRAEQRAESALVDAAEYAIEADLNADLIGDDEPSDAYEPAIRYWGAEVQP